MPNGKTDDVARYNKERWEELARANVAYSVPFLDLDVATARQTFDPEPEPGSWPHFMRVAAPYLAFWTRYRLDVLESANT